MNYCLVWSWRHESWGMIGWSSNKIDTLVLIFFFVLLSHRESSLLKSISHHEKDRIRCADTEVERRVCVRQVYTNRRLSNPKEKKNNWCISRRMDDLERSWSRVHSCSSTWMLKHEETVLILRRLPSLKAVCTFCTFYKKGLLSSNYLSLMKFLSIPLRDMTLQRYFGRWHFLCNTYFYSRLNTRLKSMDWFLSQYSDHGLANPSGFYCPQDLTALYRFASHFFRIQHRLVTLLVVIVIFATCSF